jgi:hypothetical protein
MIARANMRRLRNRRKPGGGAGPAVWGSLLALVVHPARAAAAFPANPTNIIDDLRLLQAPRPWPLVAWELLILAALLAAAYYLRRRRLAQRAPKPVLVAPEVASEDALAELARLRKKIAVENSRVYAIEVSGVVRRYIERRFGIHAPRRSTEEFLAEAHRSPIMADKYQQLLGHFLACCDFLKFARGYAEVPELEMLHEAAVRFVTETGVTPTVQAAASATAANSAAPSAGSPPPPAASATASGANPPPPAAPTEARA